MIRAIGLLFLSTTFGVLGCSTKSGNDELTTEGNAALATSTVTVQVTCTSQVFQRRDCPVDTQGGRITDARITHDDSTPPFLCNQGGSHGFEGDRVWVDHGCSAEFDVTIEIQNQHREQIQCASSNNRYVECNSHLQNIRDIRLISHQSSAPCQEGQSFGHTNRAVWVDRGCRGVFEVSNSSGDGSDNRVELFDQGNFNGSIYGLTGDISNFANVGFNDRAESLIVYGGTWEACQDADYTGLCQTFSPGRYSQLGSLNGQISSIRRR